MREKAGHYCTVPVFISGSRYAVSPASRIESDMKKFVKWFNDNEHKLPTPEFAVLAHQKFVFFYADIPEIPDILEIPDIPEMVDIPDFSVSMVFLDDLDNLGASLSRFLA